MNIITGYTGTPHITSAQDRDGNQGSYGAGSYILDIGSKMAATIVSANEIKIADGALSHQGCLGNIDSGLYESCAISNGSQGMKRSDLIVCRYEKDADTNVESLSIVVIEGTPDASSPSDPSYNSGNIQEGDSPVDMPLYRVSLDGVNVTAVTRLASYVRTQAEMDALLGTTSISSIGDGTVTGAISTINGAVITKTSLGNGVTLTNGTYVKFEKTISGSGYEQYRFYYGKNASNCFVINYNFTSGSISATEIYNGSWRSPNHSIMPARS